MGHYFVFSHAKEVMGVNHGGVILVARKDFLIPILEKVDDGVPDSLEKTLRKMFGPYTHKYLSVIDAMRKDKALYEEERRRYERVLPLLRKDCFNFRVKDLIKKTNVEILDSILEIFLSAGSSVTYELISDGEVLRIAEKPSSITKFFTGREIGATIHSCVIKNISDIEVTEREIRLFCGSNHFMSVRRSLNG